jgi:Fe-S cluster assembly ATPase SufC
MKKELTTKVISKLNDLVQKGDIESLRDVEEVIYDLIYDETESREPVPDDEEVMMVTHEYDLADRVSKLSVSLLAAIMAYDNKLDKL